ncbi:VCBS domain-containing protein, partial [Bradyrhizobium sp. LjRoot220]|uniref:VCBS domain-containing protein n=1 Tax=Bradyrhizobium sp. LjRoot220 TaxID=3342284 RepID=UPI003F4FB985
MNKKSIFDFLSDFITGIFYFFDRPPVARPDAARIGEDAGLTSLDVLSNDRDPDWGDTLHVASIRGNLKGAASISADGRHIDYNPGNAFQYLGAGQTATEVIRYTVADRFGKTSESIARVTIVGENDAAVLSSQTVNLTEGNTAAAISAAGALTISDVDSPAVFVAQSNIAGQYGHFSIDSAGVWNYVADTAHNEFAAGTTYTDAFAVTSADGTATSVTVNIAGTAEAAGSFHKLTYLVKIDGIEGTSQLEHYAGYFEVDAFTFGELTTLASSGGGGGGSGKAVFDPLMIDINGVSAGLVELLGNAATGEHIRTVDLVGLKIAGDRTDEVYRLTLDNATVSGVAIDGDDTAVAFGFSEVTQTIREQNPDGTLGTGQTFSFDLGREGGSVAPVDREALAAMAHEDEDPALTYLVKIDGIEGTSQLDGYAGYFEVDAFTFGELTALASSGGGGAGSGKAVFDPLMIDIDGLSPGLVELLGNAATGE